MQSVPPFSTPGMKQFFSLASVLCGVLLACLFSSCGDPYEKNLPRFSDIQDLNSSDYRLGMPLGATAMYAGETKLSKARPSYFNSHHAAYSALLQEKIDAYVFDSHTLEYVAANTPDFAILPGSIGTVDIAIGVSPDNATMLQSINEFIDSYKKNGTYKEMYARWIQLGESDDDPYARREVPAMPKITAPTNPTRTLVVGTCSQLEPMCFRIPGEGEEPTLTGFDIELLRRLALHLNVNIELRDMDYVSLINKLASGELDLVIAGLNKTTEREERVLFSKNYIDSRIVALVRSKQVKEK